MESSGIERCSGSYWDRKTKEGIRNENCNDDQ